MGSSLLYISIAYNMQKGGGWVQIAYKNTYVLNGRPLVKLGVPSPRITRIALTHWRAVHVALDLRHDYMTICILLHTLLHTSSTRKM